MTTTPSYARGGANLHWADILVLIGYFIAVIGVGIWSSRRSKRDSVSGYFLASRSMHWIPVGASLFASNIGSGHFIGLAGSGANSGIGIGGFELNALYVLLILGWLFVPVYLAAGVYTMPEYLRKRFGGQRIRIYLSILALLLYIFTKISADLYAGALFIKQSLGWDLYASVGALLIIAALFTVAGGLSAVIWTDFVQTILMVIGAATLSFLSFKEVGGYKNLVENFYTKQPNESYVGYNSQGESCSQVPENYMHLLRKPDDPELPWTGMTFGNLILGIWYWCSDQVIVQRTLSSKDMSHAKGGCIFAGYLKLLPLFLLVFPGMASRVLFTDEVGCSNPERCKEICGSPGGCTNIAYPLLVLRLMPPGASGMMLAVMMAALMSSLTSIFNSSSTLFTMDIWRRIRKEASEIELLIVGRAFVVVLVIISIIWIPIIEVSQGSQLFHYIQSVQSYLAPPVCAIYLLAILWDRINEQGAFWGLMIGLATGLTRFILDFSYPAPACASNEPDLRPAILTKIHYLHFGCLLFLISTVSTIVISLLTAPLDKKHLYRLTYWTRHNPEERDDLDHKKKKTKSANGSITVSTINVGEVNVAFQDVDPVKTEAIVYKNNDIKLPDELPQDIEDQSSCKKAMFFICGINKEQQNEQAPPVLTPAEEAAQANESIKERPFWKTFCNFQAIILLIISSFFWGYYA